MWRMILQPLDDAGDVSRAFPQRTGVPDCLYYARTGMCHYGISCRFNHPPPKSMSDEAFERRDDYPEREGQPECQFYLKTGTCKFGSTCKFHHPRDKAGIFGKASLNKAGYPLRLGENDCSYYLQTGTCKFGTLCKFNHPQPTSLSTTMAGTGATSEFPLWSLPREPCMPGLPLHSSCYASFLVPPAGLVSMPGWTAYQGQMRPVMPISPLNMKQHTFGAAAIYGAGSRNIHASYSPSMVGSAATGLLHSINLSKDFNFPERPGRPECKYYMKTGDCKFGASCHFDHPKRRILSLLDGGLNSQGFPERPGTQPCGYYMQHGTCKFGITCRFDHPRTSLTHSPFPKSIMNCHLFPYPQRFAFPRLLHPSVNTLAVANVQQSNKDDETALMDGKSVANQTLESGELSDSLNGGESKALESGELRDSLNGCEPKAST